MSTVRALGTTVLPMAEQLDPNDVRPGWLALAVFLAMAAATALLLRSFVKQTRRIDFDDGIERGPDGRPVHREAPRAPRTTPDAATDEGGDGPDPDPPAPR